MSFDVIYHHKTRKKLTRLSSLYIVIITHRCISTIINFKATKFGHNLFHDPVPPNINFNYISYLIWQCYANQTVMYQISILHSWSTICKFDTILDRHVCFENSKHEIPALKTRKKPRTFVHRVFLKQTWIL